MQKNIFENRGVIVGTVPFEGEELRAGEAILEDGLLIVSDLRIPCGMGTAAAASAMAVTLEYLGEAPPIAVIIGDTGKSGASSKLYEYVEREIIKSSLKTLTMHYMMPNIKSMRKISAEARKTSPVPFIIADAGSMYAIKAGGISSDIGLMTPDLSELAFMADKDASHPAYIARHLFDTSSSDPEELLMKALDIKAVPNILIIKGKTDYVVQNGKIVCRINQPDNPEMEAIGGTGDTITGSVSALISAGFDPVKAAVIALKVNRLAGKHLKASDSVRSLIENLPGVYRDFKSPEDIYTAE